MTKELLVHEKINGTDYKALILNAAQCLEDNENQINELNVFPVPDGDTGSNMSKTVSTAAKELLKDDSESLDTVAEKTAKAMLHGARGNSGVIVSLLFRGIAKGLKSSFECDGKAWAEALEQGVISAYNAIERPAEGTILTVARKCAEAAKQAAEEYNNFQYVLGVAIEAAEEALDETINENPVLEKAGVVDAGGMGWLLVMKSMYSALTKENIIEYQPKEKAIKKERADFSEFETESINFSFCTEFIITKLEPNSDTSPLKSYLGTMGDSLVMLDDGEIVKVHIHTNEPHQVLGEALKWGIYENVKVENMKSQHTSKIVEIPQSKMKDYGIVAVASGDGISQIFTELGCDIVVSGGQTMNPSTEELYNAVKKVNANTVFILPNNKNIIMTAEQVREISDKEIVVIPTKTIPQGINAMLAFNEENGVSENEEAMNELSRSISTMQITYAARNSSFDGMDICQGDYLGLLENKMIINHKNIDTVLSVFAKEIEKVGKEAISIYYGSDVSESEAERAKEYLVSLLPNAQIELYNGNQPVYYYIISAE
ncbi:MAG: DAK2 domain-containing protein [Clostridia bacterium]|nr:DAK2 domain-containing protein [Clostridia bacterium]